MEKKTTNTDLSKQELHGQEFSEKKHGAQKSQ